MTHEVSAMQVQKWLDQKVEQPCGGDEEAEAEGAFGGQAVVNRRADG
jgi:hypothetical protein